MGLSITVSSIKELLRALEPTSGPAVKCTQGNGKIAKWKVLESCHGQMELNMLDSSKRTNFMAKASIDGALAKFTTVAGKMANSTAKAN